MYIKTYIKEAIKLEVNMSRLYVKFSLIKNHEFWLTISLEEVRHADILKNISFAAGVSDDDLNNLNNDFIDSKESVDELILMNEKVEALIDSDILEEDIFKIALELEASAGEAHYQKLVNKDSDNVIVKTFMKLSKADSDHYKRILKQSKIQ